MQLRALEREAKAQRDLLETYLAKYREANTRETIDTAPTDGRIISRAIVSNMPAYPKKLPIVLIATIATLLLSSGVVVTGELLRQTAPRAVAVFTPAQTRTSARQEQFIQPMVVDPVMAEPAPLQPEMTADADVSEFAEIERLAASLRAAGAGAKKVTVLGTAAGEAVTLSTLTLARYLARDARVVVVDLAASSPTMAAVSVDASAPGLAELMQGEASFAQIITRDKLSRLHLVLPGRPGFDRSLLQSPRVTLAVDALLRAYDHVLLDAGSASDLPAELLTANARAVVVPDASMAPDARALMCEQLSAVGFSEVTMLSKPVQPSKCGGCAARRGGVGKDRLPERASQPLREVEQHLVLFHQPLAVAQRGHCHRREFSARRQRNKTVENVLVVLAEHPLVLVRADAKVERTVAALGIAVDDVAHQDQPGAVTGVLGHRVGVEHHRVALAIGDAGEDRDHLVVAFERVDVDDAAFTAQRKAGAADELLDAGLGEDVGKLLFGHPRRLDAEEPVEQAGDVRVRGRQVIAIAGESLELLLLALETTAEGIADPRRRRTARLHREQRATVDRALARQQHKRILLVVPVQRLLRQCEHVDMLAQGRKQHVEIGDGDLRCKLGVPQAHVEGRMLAAHEAGRAHAVVLAQRERQQQERPMPGVAGNDDEGAGAFVFADQALPGTQQVKSLIGREEVTGLLEGAPDRLGRAEIGDDIDMRDAARFRPRWRFCRPALHRRSHGHSRNLSRNQKCA
ncbi:Mrp family chromosome partitioning ATPase [Bradyrhizobium sp. LB1.3]